MAGTVIGGRKAVITNRAKHGEDFYKIQGKKGGSAKVKKGFAISGLASSAGRKGGAHSSRKGVKNGSNNIVTSSDYSDNSATDGGYGWDTTTQKSQN